MWLCQACTQEKGLLTLVCAGFDVVSYCMLHRIMLLFFCIFFPSYDTRHFFCCSTSTFNNCMHGNRISIHFANRRKLKYLICSLRWYLLFSPPIWIYTYFESINAFRKTHPPFVAWGYNFVYIIINYSIIL